MLKFCKYYNTKIFSILHTRNTNLEPYIYKVIQIDFQICKMLFFFLLRINPCLVSSSHRWCQKKHSSYSSLYYSSWPLLRWFFICLSIFISLSVNSPTCFSFIPVLFYHIQSFTLIHLPAQALRSSAGEEQQPFSSMSHRHANGEIIQPVFVDAAATAPPGPNLLCASVVEVGVVFVNF